MRTWIGGTCLTVCTLGGLAFVLAGRPHPSHVGPCVSGTREVETGLAPARLPCGCEADAGPDVTDVVAPEAVAGVQVEPRRLPFINFDEPPLAPVTPAGLTVPADAPKTIPPAKD